MAAMTARWFHPNIHGPEAEVLLKERGVNGSFLVRPSKGSPGDFALSVRRSETDVIHIKIQSTDEFYDFYGGEKFASLPEIIEYYLDHPDQLREKDGQVIKLLYPLNAAEPTHERWFHGALTGHDAEVLLAKQRPGTFLVRESQSEPGFYSLSVRAEFGPEEHMDGGHRRPDHCPSLVPPGTVTHIKIRCDSHGYDLMSDDKSDCVMTFTTLSEMIEHYRRHPMVAKTGTVINLRQPLNATKLNVSDISTRVNELQKASSSIVQDAHSSSINDEPKSAPQSPSYATVALRKSDVLARNQACRRSLALAQGNSDFGYIAGTADQGFWEEFEKLQRLESEHTHQRREGDLPENRAKNRYKNILPYDFTRVVLVDLDGESLVKPSEHNQHHHSQTGIGGGQNFFKRFAHTSFHKAVGEAAKLSSHNNNMGPGLDYINANYVGFVGPHAGSQRYYVSGDAVLSAMNDSSRSRQTRTRCQSGPCGVGLSTNNQLAGHSSHSTIASNRFSHQHNLVSSSVSPCDTSVDLPQPLAATYRKYYIATQGCLPNTTGDFWHMVWQENCRVIVMTTKEMERSKSKCARYWPKDVGQTEIYSSAIGSVALQTLSAQLESGTNQSSAKGFHFGVKFTTQSRMTDYTLRQFKLVRLTADQRQQIVNSVHSMSKSLEQDESGSRHCDLRVDKIVDFDKSNGRTVYQFHFHAWPDHGVPSDPGCVLNFLHDVNVKQDALVRSQRPDGDNAVIGPVVVHCSAGIGRTGTFIVIDMILDQIVSQGIDLAQVDVANAVIKVRSQRSGMVQTEAQYKFIYMAIQHFVETAQQRMIMEQEAAKEYTNIDRTTEQMLSPLTPLPVVQQQRHVQTMPPSEFGSGRQHSMSDTSSGSQLNILIDGGPVPIIQAPRLPR